MKDPADAYTLELPHLGIIALPDWLPAAAATCPDEAARFAMRMDELQTVPNDAPMPLFMVAYGRMLEARHRLYDAWLEVEPDDSEDPIDLDLELEREYGESDGLDDEADPADAA